MAIFNSYFDITRGYSWWLHPNIGQLGNSLQLTQLTQLTALARITMPTISWKTSERPELNENIESNVAWLDWSRVETPVGFWSLKFSIQILLFPEGLDWVFQALLSTHSSSLDLGWCACSGRFTGKSTGDMVNLNLLVECDTKLGQHGLSIIVIVY